MNSERDRSEESGNGVAPVSNIETPTSSSSNPEKMKRTAVEEAARQKIEHYYYQLTDGCGSSDCQNKLCASSPAFVYRNISTNDAAACALELFKNKSLLCVENKPNKKAKESSESKSSGDGASSSTSDQPSTSKTVTSGTGQKPAAEGKVSPCPARKEIACLTEDSLSSVITVCESENNWSQLIRTIGSVYNNPESLIRSFLLEPPSVPTKEELRAMEVDQDKDKDEKESDTDSDSDEEPVLDTGQEGPSSSNSASSHKTNLKEDEITVDLESVRRAYKQLFAITDLPFQGALTNALIYLSRTMDMDLRYHKAYDRDPNYLNIFLVVLEIPVLFSSEFIESATPSFCKALGNLPTTAQAKLARIWSKFPKEKLKDWVDGLQQLITVRVITNQWSRMHVVSDDEGIAGATKVMKILYYACVLSGRLDPDEILEEEREMNEQADENLQELLQGAVGREGKEKNQPKSDPLEKELSISFLDCRDPLIPYEDFVNEPLSDQIEMDRDYANYKNERENKFSFMNHSFILTTAAKSLGMYFDNRISMMNERRASVFQNIVHGAPTVPYLRLRIRRDHVIDDALVALEMAAMDNPAELKKQLYVEFEGEQGIDEGGVSKEFFQLVVEEIFNPDIGMFTYDEETRQFWFNPTSFENDGQFTLIGIMLGLAIYNNIILDVSFPMVVYRKLMGKKGLFEDLKDSHPSLAKGLQDLLEYDGDVEETFMHSMQISYKDVFGSTLTHQLKENGDQIPITNANRKEFVDLYADFLLNKSVERQFRAFKRGFQMVTDESPLKMLFRPDEVEILVCGSKHFDFHALEESTDYDGGFTQESQTVKYFWEVVHEFSEEQKRQLLQFTTGSDRVPVGGLAKLKLVVARNGPDSDRLPTSHTCFNVILLPDYATKDKLRERLLKAITHAKGFGML